MRTALLLFAALVAAQSPALGQGKPEYPGTMSGETLLRNYMGPPGPRDDPFLKGGDIVNHEMARGFMDGIKDVTESSVWCYGSGKPHELNDDIAADLAKLPPAELKKRAGPLVMKVLRQRFPCPSTTVRKAP